MSQCKKQTPIAKDKTDYFSWSDDEVDLSLSLTMDYKTSKEMENIIWESCQSKYQTLEEAKVLGKEYPHSRTQMTKAILTSKLKIMRQKYQLVVDNGRWSGHGRVHSTLSCANRYGLVFLHILPYHLALRQHNFQKCVLILKRSVPLVEVLQIAWWIPGLLITSKAVLKVKT